MSIATFAHDESVPLDYCIVTATMGNYARLRRLQLADRVVTACELWSDYREEGFSPHAKFPLAELIRSADGHASAIATTDELAPATASYAPGTAEHWKYRGRLARQIWTSLDPDPELEVWLNGRYMYWASRSPIPGGISFENFEMVTPFEQGEEFEFRVEPVADAQ